MATPNPAPVLVGGEWRASEGRSTFTKSDPADGRSLGDYPVSPWHELSTALDHAVEASEQLMGAGPELAARFLDAFADQIESHADAVVKMAHEETALPIEPRLRSVELPRTTGQLRQAARAARDRSWTMPTIDPDSRIASMLGPIPGAAVVFGPNNFPLAFNSVSGGDFVAAVATGHAVVAKANPGHPGTTRLLAELAGAAAASVGAPASIVQLVYRTSHADGAALVSDRRVAATGYTGARGAGLALKAAADATGIPIYLELSSINPVVVLPTALDRRDEIAAELAQSVLSGVGQFCTSPGLILVPSGADGDGFVDAFGELVATAPPATLLDSGVRDGLERAAKLWTEAGARVVRQGPPETSATRYPHTVMAVSAPDFLAHPADLQAEAFGNQSLVVRYGDRAELASIVGALEANLTGTVYTAGDGLDAEEVAATAQLLRPGVGRLIIDHPPTGVAVVPSMNHGGPYPATGHPGFTAVGIPASLRRFGMLQSYDGFAAGLLPPELQPDNPLGIQRFVAGEWTRDPVEWVP